MIGWVIGRCGPQKEHALALDIAEISKNEPIQTYVPVHLFYRSLSRYAQARKPVRELIAPRMVFMQAGFQKINLIKATGAGLPIKKQLEPKYFLGQRVEGTIEKVQQLRGFEGFVLDNNDWPYVIPHDAMTQFMISVDRTNLFAEQMEQEALGRVAEAKKTTWRKLVDETRDKLNYMLFGKYRD